MTTESNKLPGEDLIDEKLFNNIYRFVALCATSEEYYLHISDGLIALELKFLREEETKKGKHPKQILKMCERRYKELSRMHVNRKKFFSDFVKRFNVPPYEELVDGYVDKLNDVLQTITINDRKDAPNQT